MGDPVRTSQDFYHNSLGPVCPHCNCQHIADEAVYYDEGLCKLDCDHCGKQFSVRVFTNTTWTTNIDDPDAGALA